MRGGPPRAGPGGMPGTRSRAWAGRTPSCSSCALTTSSALRRCTRIREGTRMPRATTGCAHRLTLPALEIPPRERSAVGRHARCPLQATCHAAGQPLHRAPCDVQSDRSALKAQLCRDSLSHAERVQNVLHEGRLVRVPLVASHAAAKHVHLAPLLQTRKDLSQWSSTPHAHHMRGTDDRWFPAASCARAPLPPPPRASYARRTPTASSSRS